MNYKGFTINIIKLNCGFTGSYWRNDFKYGNPFETVIYRKTERAVIEDAKRLIDSLLK